MNINKSVKDSGDATKVQKSKTSVSNQVNKVVSEGGDSKTVFVDRKEIARTKVNHKNIYDIKANKAADESPKPHKKSNQSKTENTTFFDRKSELVIRKSNNQNTTNAVDIAKKSDGKESFKSSPADKEHGTQGLVNNVIKIPPPQILTPKDIRKRYDVKERLNKKPASNECSQDITEKVCDKDVRIPSNQEIVTNVSIKKPEPQITTKKDRNITINAPSNKERDQNITVNLYNKDVKIPSKDLVNNEKYDFKNIAIKDRDTSKLHRQESYKNYSVNNKHQENVKLNIDNRHTKMSSTPRLNNVSTKKYDPRAVTTKHMQQRHIGDESIRTYPVTLNKEYDQSTTVNNREDRTLNKHAEKKNVVDKNISKHIYTKTSNSNNNKQEDSPKPNFRSETTEGKMKNDRSIKKTPQQTKKFGELLSEIENKKSSHTGIYSSDLIDDIKMPVTSPPPLRKRPVIKTITARNDKAKVYKAVAFVDQKKKRTPLKINLADAFVRPKTGSDRRINLTFSKGSVKDKVVNEKVVRKKENLKRDKLKRKQCPKTSEPRSPLTEVAKLAPNCINNHTKQYYEAWVDTTLAAISKDSRSEKLFLDKQSIFQNGIEKAFAEGPYIPELVKENLTDERFMGKIRIRQR